jgi:predicted RecA/RadA family phage recombinase
MVAKYRANGRTVKYTPPSAVVAGTFVKVSNFCGIPDNDIPANTQGDLTVSGVYEADGDSSLITAIATAGGYAIGVPVDINLSDQKLRADGVGDGNILLFTAEAIATGGGGTARVFLNHFGD